jgi:hypothetical protein
MEMTGSLSPEAMFKMAQGLRDDRLTAILAGQDDSLPQYVAQAVLSGRQRIRQAHAGQQAQARMAQQQQSKKDELLAQAQNIQGIASVAPDSVAQLAGGGIVAFSGESGNQEVRQPSRGLNEAYRRTGTLLPETSGYEGLGPIDFIRRILGEGAAAVSRADDRMKRRSMQSALPAYNPDPLLADLPSTANSRSPTPVEAAQAAPALAPTRSVGGGGGGGGRAAPAAAAPAAAQGFNTSKYFPELKEPRYDLGALQVTNPYEKAKPTEEYIKDHKALLKQFGVSETPYAEREAELKAAQAADVEKRRNAGLMGLFNFGTMLAGSGGRNVAQSIGMAGQKAAERYQADVEKLDALEEKRKEALQAIRMANNDIKRGQVEKGLAERDRATKEYNDTELKLADVRARREESQASLAGQRFQTETQYGIAQGQAGASFDLKMRELAQDLQLSREKIAATIQAAKISAAARGDRVPMAQDAYNALVAQGVPKLQALEAVRRAEGVVKAESSPLAALGINNPPAGAVREKGK